MRSSPRLASPDIAHAVEIRVRGRVQGVGFRPFVWRLAQSLGLSGEVFNDAQGVIIRAAGSEPMIRCLLDRIETRKPPLARIDGVEISAIADPSRAGFRIAESVSGGSRTQVAPDAAICAACAHEVVYPAQRRHGYAFANCTHCGPRLTIVTGVPYDRQRTTMAEFALCRDCLAEYHDPQNRRFHAAAMACPRCGPQVCLVKLQELPARASGEVADIDAVCALLRGGSIIALKNLGGYQLACDATNKEAVLRLREVKRRPAKPFALMARDLETISRYCKPSEEEKRLLGSAQGPIVLLRATGPEVLPEAVAPGLRTIGFMLPTTPLHLLALRRMDRPVVMTSGNIAEEPQITDDEEALRRFAGIADHMLIHNRDIAMRVDDSVARVMRGEVRLLRRARGYAPEPIRLPHGFDVAPDLLAFGGDLKSTFCLVKGGEAVLSQHQGDLQDATTFADFERNLARYAELFDHSPRGLAADQHPEYLSSKLARDRVRTHGLPLENVQHHHAHVAACLAENGWPLDGPPVLGVVLDGTGWGSDGTIWGGEFLRADYRRFERLATFKPIPMIGGDQAAREPWRNLYAHLTARPNWEELERTFAGLELCRYLAAKPRSLLDAALRLSINAPLASSCGRLFDAMAAALGLCRDVQRYEGEAACRLESLVHGVPVQDARDQYPFTTSRLPGSGLPCIEPGPMWTAVFADLAAGVPPDVMAARFHRGLAEAVVAMAVKVTRVGNEHGSRVDTVALSGGCFQNAVLFDLIVTGLEAQDLRVLTHRIVPANDGGLSLGQAAVAAARLIGANEC
jgi:hydrogenase maturation protein HypF